MTKNNTTEHYQGSLNRFFASVERKAYSMALLSLKHHDEVLDIIQDAMTRFVISYAEKPEQEWRPLFYRVLQNLILDWHRKQKVRRILLFWQDSEQQETIEFGHQTTPESVMVNDQKLNQALAVLNQLPVRQQQCFMLRNWEGLSVADTALAMGCSEGSVKTHLSRAMAKLNELTEVEHD